jgi:hypothetical protein
MAKTLEKLALPFLIGGSALALYAGASAIGKEKSSEIGYRVMQENDLGALAGPAALGAVSAAIIGGLYVLMKKEED